MPLRYHWSSWKKRVCPRIGDNNNYTVIATLEESKMKHITTYIILWSIAFGGYAQYTQIDLSQKVGVGNTLPSIPPQSALFYKQNKIDLHDYKNKVLILDFFDTYCSSCIASLPKLQKVQNEIGDQLQIVMITWQDSETIEKFWSTNKFIQEHNIHLPIIYNDSLLRKYFPHRVIPHVAWLFQDKVQAVTHSDFVTADRIVGLYEHGHITLPLKHDFEDQLAQSQSAKNVKGSVLLTGFQEGRPTESYSYGLDSLTGMYKTSFYNMPIFGAYTAIWSKIKKPEFLLKPDRIVWEVTDSSLYKNFGLSGTGQIWLSEHGICYERYEQVQRDEKKQVKIVQADLNSIFGLQVYWSTRKMPAFVIRGRYKKPKNMKTIDGQRMEGTSVLAFDLDMSGQYPPVIDEVKSKELLVIPQYRNLEELNLHLKSYGLQIVRKVADVEVLVFQADGKQ